MSQLKMYWLPGPEVPELPLPEGYSYSNYKDESDKMAWVACCRQGLVADDADESTFDSSILSNADTQAETDLFFIDHDGEHVGTVTAIYEKAQNTGRMHMVGIRPDFRGRGLGKYLCNVTLRKLQAQGVRRIVLTTDEWRKPAIRSYLSAGFLPVEYDVDMQQRWIGVLRDLNIDSVDMVDEEGRYFTTLHQ